MSKQVLLVTGAAQGIYSASKVAAMKQPPTRLYLGGSALAALQYKVNNIIDSVNQYVELSNSIDN